MHKRKWVNTKYLYQRHIFYDSSSAYLSVRAHLSSISVKLQFWLRQLLRKLKFHRLYGRLVRWSYRADKAEAPKGQIPFVLNQKLEMPSIEGLTPIDLTEETNAFLRKPLYDFLYTNHESKQEVSVFGHPENSNQFYFKGKNAKAALLLS